MQRFLQIRTKENFMQTRKSPQFGGDNSSSKIGGLYASVAMAAVIFWGFTLTGNTDTTVQELTVAESIRAGDTLTASADPTKFTGC